MLSEERYQFELIVCEKMKEKTTLRQGEARRGKARQGEARRGMAVQGTSE